MKKGSGQLPPELLDAAVELMGRAGRGGTVRVTGASMVPTLIEGQLLAVEFSPDALRFGDLLVFRQADYLVVHRLVGRPRRPGGERYLRTRGDAMIGLDPPVEPSRVVGRVTAVRDGERWRSVRGSAARGYARLLAAHDLFWASVGVLARFSDRVARRLRLPFRLLPLATAADRLLLSWAHRLLFARVHAETGIPPEARAGSVLPGG